MIERSALIAALDTVVDPCSQALGEPIGLHEMGLVPDVVVDDTGAVSLRMRLTSPCCAYGPMLAEAARRELESVAGVSSVSVVIDHSAMWQSDDIEPSATVRLERRRAVTVHLTDVRPFDWSSRP